MENDSPQAFFNMWCKAWLTNGEYIWCWPQYQGNEDSRYHWAMVEFESKNNDEAESLLYPAKILTLYEDVKGNINALVHLVEYKMASGVEGTFDDCFSPRATLPSLVCPRQWKAKSVLCAHGQDPAFHYGIWGSWVPNATSTFWQVALPSSRLVAPASSASSHLHCLNL